MNYPNVAEGATAKKAVWASVGDETYAYHGYVPQADGSYKIALSACSGLPDCEESKRDSAALSWLFSTFGCTTFVSSTSALRL